jgi:hypothetical protein
MQIGDPDGIRLILVAAPVGHPTGFGGTAPRGPGSPLP